ncbi:MAG: ATP-binding protein [Prevotella sp.]|nr:ATP-binding protein [Prevotella sp.]
MTKFPIGIQNFEKLREDGFVYIDKTKQIYHLVGQGGYYFLSRPRRFGKSLLISTLEAYFEGKRELFKDLAIEQLETEWQQYPILHLDLNAEDYSSKDALQNILNRFLSEWEKIYGSDEAENTVSGRFAGVIRRAYEKTGKKVVILVDEYDKPMVMNFDNDELQDRFRNTLKAFYGVMKSCDRYIRFALLTGVTKFSKVSVFSDLNNLRDISMLKDYEDICGLTEQEIREHMNEGVEALAEACSLSVDDCYAKLKKKYDGYHFCYGGVGIYNPFSVINTLQNRAFGNYWFSTGTPTQLVVLLKNCNFNLNDLTTGEISTQMLGSIETMRENPVPLIFQSGYLTIKDYDEEFDLYKLGFPNVEVESSFMGFLMPLYSNSGTNSTQFGAYQFVREIRNGQPEAFMKRLSAMMADTDYRIVGDSELYFQNFCYVFFRLLGFYVEVERATSDGRMDMIIKTKDYIYIMEFKLNKTADEALKQIEEKGYALSFSADKRTIYKIGINFNLDKRCIDEWKVA